MEERGTEKRRKLRRGEELRKALFNMKERRRLLMWSNDVLDFRNTTKGHLRFIAKGFKVRTNDA